ncbi:hypothetical protein JCM10213_005122 [Rhodosporidiobolus nylandii]
MANNEETLRRLEEENRALRDRLAAQDATDDRMEQLLILQEDRKDARLRKFQPKISSASGASRPNDGTCVSIANFPRSPIIVSPDCVELLGRALYLPPLSLLTPEAINRADRHLRSTYEPTGKEGSYETVVKRVREEWEPLDKLLPFEELFNSLQSMMRLIDALLVPDDERQDFLSDFVAFILDMQARCISHHSYEIYRDYILLKIDLMRRKIKARVGWTNNRLQPFEQEVMDKVAATYGAQGAAVEAMFVTATTGAGQSPWGAIVKTVTEKDKPAAFVKQLVAEQEAISKRIFEHKEPRGRVPASVGFRAPSLVGEAAPPAGPRGGGGGTRGGYGQQQHRPTPIQTSPSPFLAGSMSPPQYPSGTTTPAWNPTPSASSSGFSTPRSDNGWPQFSYAGGKVGSSFGSSRASPYPSPSPRDPKADIKALYSALFLAIANWRRCIYCRDPAHEHTGCPAPLLPATADPIPQVYPTQARDVAICSNFNRSICPAASAPSPDTSRPAAPPTPSVEERIKKALTEIITTLKYDKFKYYFDLYDMHSLPEFNGVLDIIQNGTDLGITVPPPTSSIIYKNHVDEDGPLAVYVDETLDKERDKERMDGGFPLKTVEKVAGPIRTNPLSLIPKAVGPPAPPKFRMVENTSYPKFAKEGFEPSINSSIGDEDAECSFHRFWEVARFMLCAAEDEEAEVGGIDIETAFHHIPLHASVRLLLALWWRELVHIRKVVPFGTRSAPAVFILLMSATLYIFKKRFGDKVAILPHMDDLSIAIFDKSVSLEDVIAALEELGWVVEKKKTQPLARTTVHVGVLWDLNRRLAIVPEKKKVKYTRKIDNILSTLSSTPGGKIKYREWESLVGSLQYVATVVPALRPHLRVMYNFKHAYPNRNASRTPEQREVKELRFWKDKLSPGAELCSSFDKPPPPNPDYFTADAASGKGIGIYIRTAPNKNGDSFLFTESWPLLPGWENMFETKAAIYAAEAWATEVLLEAAVHLGAKNCTLTLRTDNETFRLAFAKGWSSNPFLNASIARINEVSSLFSLSINLIRIASKDNEADAVSRLEPVEGELPYPFPLSPPPGTAGGADPYSRSGWFSSAI